MCVCQPCGATLKYLTHKTLRRYSLHGSETISTVFLCPDCNSVIAGNKRDADKFLKTPASSYGKQFYEYSKSR